jgi:hypothetical protein
MAGRGEEAMMVSISDGPARRGHHGLISVQLPNCRAGLSGCLTPDKVSTRAEAV